MSILPGITSTFFATGCLRRGQFRHTYLFLLPFVLFQFPLGPCSSHPQESGRRTVVLPWVSSKFVREGPGWVAPTKLSSIQMIRRTQFLVTLSYS